MESPSQRREKSPKFLEARERVPEDLRAVFDQLVDEYHFRTCTRFGGGHVAYQVIADLVLMGWRQSADSLLEDRGDTAQHASRPTD